MFTPYVVFTKAGPVLFLDRARAEAYSVTHHGIMAPMCLSDNDLRRLEDAGVIKGKEFLWGDSKSR